MVQESPSYPQAEDKTDGLKGKAPPVSPKRHCFSCLGRYLAYAESRSEMKHKSWKKNIVLSCVSVIYFFSFLKQFLEHNDQNTLYLIFLLETWAQWKQTTKRQLSRGFLVILPEDRKWDNRKVTSNHLLSVNTQIKSQVKMQMTITVVVKRQNLKTGNGYMGL